jgi:hypothetical protein
MKALSICLAISISALAISCTGVKNMDTTEIDTISDAEVRKGLETIAGRKLFFGHQSVGWNIIDGLKDISASAGISLPPAVKTRSAGDIAGAGLYHAEVGKNVDPMC